MSLPTSSAPYMFEDSESFHKFFESWLVEQNQYLEKLVSASKENQQREEQAVSQQELNETILIPLIEKVIQHYEHYYRAKSRWAKNDVLIMFNPSWTSSLEDAFLWIGGWRPSMAVHLLYSKSGLQLEARIVEILRGISTGDLGDLSPGQLEKVDELQKVTIREEKELSEKMAKKQEGVADKSMVELSHAVTEMMREGAAADEQMVEAALGPKEEGLVQVLQKADDLRMNTLRKVVGLLSPVQSVHFLIAAAELHLRFHDWGKKRDARIHQAAEGSSFCLYWELGAGGDYC
ncbi:protein DOG1-like 4 isoform X2 [Primulina eburnea]|uniref:protein DOG1-like 4 isoform X2 n=1 Tax=Primulina eburnea TaxID=1245227 RepID=UPI003C6BE95A